LIFIFSPVKYFYRYLATGCLLGKEVKLIKDEDSEHLGKRGLGDTGEACCSAHADGLLPEAAGISQDVQLQDSWQPSL
jgi:hypothetical protein